MMRNLQRFVFSAFTLICAITSLACFENPAHAQDWARKMFTESLHDFGKVKLGETPVYKFEFENKYNETIHIQSVTSSCGCTIATPSKRELKTWEKAEIICKFNTPAVGTGFKQATVTVRIDRPYIAEVQLTVRGTIVGGISVSPEQIEFGQVTETDLAQQVKRINLTASGNPYFRIRDVKSTFEHIKVQLFQKPRNTNGVISYEILTQLKDTAPKGFNQGELFLVVETGRNPNGTVQLQQVPVKFSAKVVSALQLSPEILSLGPLEPGQKVTKKVFLKSEKPFRIQDVRCHSEAFRVKADREAKKLHIVEVTYECGEEEGRHECELSFFVEYEDGQQQQSATDGSGVMKAIIEVVSAK